MQGVARANRSLEHLPDFFSADADSTSRASTRGYAADTAADDSDGAGLCMRCAIAAGAPIVLVDTIRTVSSTYPGGVDGGAVLAGDVDVEYDASGVSGVSGDVGGEGYAVGAAIGGGIGFGGDVDGTAAPVRAKVGGIETAPEDE